jgi:hypothetical protein
MALNRYTEWTTNVDEQQLYEDLVIEHIQTFGYDVWYIPRTIISQDDILGEDLASIFKTAHRIEVLMPNAGNFGGDQDIMSKFGFRINQTTEFMMAKKRFAELGIPGYIRPREGDLIYIGDITNSIASFGNSIFEINQVWYDWPGFQYGKNHIYKMVCELFSFSWEKFRTGIRAIDIVEPYAGGGGTSDGQDTGSLNNPAAAEGQELLKFNTGNPFGNF